MMQFHPDLITTVHRDRRDRIDQRPRRASSPRRGEDVRWVRPGRAPQGSRRRSD